MWFIQFWIYLDYVAFSAVLACLLWQYSRTVVMGYSDLQRVAFCNIVEGGLSRKEIWELIPPFAVLLVALAVIDWSINNWDTFQPFLHVIFRF